MPRTRPHRYAPEGWPEAWVLVPTGTTPAPIPGRQRPATPPAAALVPHSASSLASGYLCEPLLARPNDELTRRGVSSPIWDNALHAVGCSAGSAGPSRIAT